MGKEERNQGKWKREKKNKSSDSGYTDKRSSTRARERGPRPQISKYN